MSEARPPRPRRRDDPAIPPAPPLPRLEVEASTEPESAPATVSPFELDPVFADAISRVISQAISTEMERVRTSLAPATPAPPADSKPARDKPASDKPASEPPRSSIRVAAKKAPRWVSYAVTALALAGQLIVWFGPHFRSDLQGPLAQALELIGWLLSTLAGRIQ